MAGGWRLTCANCGIGVVSGLAAARSGAKHLSRGRPSRRHRVTTARLASHAPETPPCPKPASQRAGSRPDASQFVAGSACGPQSCGLIVSRFLSRPRRGLIQPAGSGAVTQGCPRARRPRPSTPTRVFVPSRPSSATSSPVAGRLSLSRSAWGRRPPSYAACGRRPGPAWPPAFPTPAPCRACSGGVPASAWPRHWRERAGRPPRRRPT